MGSTTHDEFARRHEELTNRCATLTRQLEDALVETDSLKLQLEASKSAPIAHGGADLPFDDSKMYRLTASFAAVVGPGGTMRYPEGKIIDDPMTLRTLHANGAKMAQV